MERVQVLTGTIRKRDLDTVRPDKDTSEHRLILLASDLVEKTTESTSSLCKPPSSDSSVLTTIYKSSSDADIGVNKKSKLRIIYCKDGVRSLS